MRQVFQDYNEIYSVIFPFRRNFFATSFEKHAFNFSSEKLLLCSIGFAAQSGGPCQTHLRKFFQKSGGGLSIR